MSFCDLGNRVNVFVVVVHGIRIGRSSTLAFDVALNTFSDGKLACTLANFRDVSARKAIRETCESVHVDIRSKGRLAKVCLEDREPGFLVRKWNVNELIETTRTHECRVNDIRSVGGTNDENRLL